MSLLVFFKEEFLCGIGFSVHNIMNCQMSRQKSSRLYAKRRKTEALNDLDGTVSNSDANTIRRLIPFFNLVLSCQLQQRQIRLYLLKVFKIVSILCIYLFCLILKIDIKIKKNYLLGF